MSKQIRGLLILLGVLVVGVVAFSARMRAVEMLPIDYDEDDYLSAAQFYAEALRQGDWQALIDYRYNYEHPPLSKMAYGLVLLGLPSTADLTEPTDPNIAPARSLPEPQFTDARLLSAVWGTLTALAVAFLNPVAGLFLAVNTWHIKYTSQVMLEGLPALTSALTVIFYTAALKSRSPSGSLRFNGWLAASAVMLGLTAASKYMYCVVGLAILVDGYLRRPEGLKTIRQVLSRWAAPLLIWGGLAVVIFFAANPSLWNDPFSRLGESVFYHAGYAQSEHVANAGYPLWQPLVWLTMPVPWHPGVFQVPLDPFVFVLALIGFGRLWRQRRVFALWLAFGLVFLLLWPTKWPQYILMLTAPLCLSAAYGLEGLLGDPLGRLIQRWRKPAQAKDDSSSRPTTRQNLRALPWLLPGITILALITLFPLVYQLAMSMTDLSMVSLRDGIQGGVWREVWQGITGQAEAVGMNPFRPAWSTEVNYTGPNLLLQVFFGGLSQFMAFEVLWTALSVALQLGLGLGVALLIERPGVRFKPLWRLLFILPWAMPEFAGALMWLQIYNPQFGWARQAADALGSSAPAFLVALSRWRGDSSMTLLLMSVAATWYGFPIMMLAATAGLKMIPSSIYDAAAMDGASGWNLFRRVVWPLILPLLAPAIIIRAVFAFNQFYLFYVIEPRDNMQTLSFISYYLVRDGAYSVSAAINIFIVAVVLVLIWAFNRWSKASEGVTYA